MISEFRLLSINDIEILCECSARTAQRILNDIKAHSKAPRIMFIHFKRWANVDNSKDVPNVEKLTPKNTKTRQNSPL